MLGQSVVLDSVASTESIRRRWKQLAAAYDAEWIVIECVCSDEDIHRKRLNIRQRHIPGWHELEWSDVEHVQGYYAPWNEPRLTVDAIDPLDENLKKVFDWLTIKKETLR